jgi:hypothetical protein
MKVIILKKYFDFGSLLTEINQKIIFGHKPCARPVRYGPNLIENFFLIQGLKSILF